MSLPHSVVRPVGRPRKPKRSTPVQGLSPAIRRALSFMVFGRPDGDNPGFALQRSEAAAAAGIADSTLLNAFRNPLVVQEFTRLGDVLRTGERPRAFRRIVHLAHDAATPPAVQMRAAAYIDGGEQHQGVSVNVAVQVNQQPGYVVAYSSDQAAALGLSPQPSRLPTIEAKPLIPQQAQQPEDAFVELSGGETPRPAGRRGAGG